MQPDSVPNMPWKYYYWQIKFPIIFHNHNSIPFFNSTPSFNFEKKGKVVPSVIYEKIKL